MRYKNYDDYVKATMDFYEKREIKINKNLLILPENIFNKFNGIIEWGHGSTNLVNKCDCKEDCGDKCKCI